MNVIPFCIAICYVIIVIKSSTIAAKGVYGIDDRLNLVLFDINSGNNTIVAKGPEGALTGESLDCFDSINNVLYIMVTLGRIPALKTGLYGYNVSNPSQDIGFIELPMIEASNFGGAGEQCIGDTNDGEVYVFGHSAKNETEQLLLSVYRNSSNISDIIVDTVNVYSSIDDALLLPGEMSIFDSKRNKFWIAGDENQTEYYYYIDAKTGDIVNKINYENWPIYACGYDTSLDQIVGISFDGWEPDDNAQYVMKHADPVDLNVTQTFPAFKEWCFWTAIGSINNGDQIWYNLLKNNTDVACRDSNGKQMYSYLVGVNITSGDLLTDPQIGNGDSQYIVWDLFYWSGN